MPNLTTSIGLAACVLAAAAAAADEDAKESPPAVGATAPDFELLSLDERPVKLSELTKRGPVVLLVLRGYPGYQCPICRRQVGQFIESAGQFADAGATVVMVYPGPADQLKQHAQEFITGITLPANIDLLIDPDYTFTNAYHLRWDAPRETAYPSTFVIDKERTVTFAKISMTHDGRASATEVIKSLPH